MEKEGLEEVGPLIAPGIGPGEETIVEAPSFSTELLGYGGDTSRRERRSRGWLYATVVLCCYGFFKEFKASEPFLTPYLVDYKNFSKIDVYEQVYPYWPYSYLVAAFFTFLLTDLFRHIPIIILESAAYLCTRVIIITGTSINDMRWMQVVYGVATATEVAYFSYIYTAVPVRRYKQVTSYLRAIRLFGQSTSGLLGQILISTHALNYLQLNYISLASVSVACVFALLLPATYWFEYDGGPCCRQWEGEDDSGVVTPQECSITQWLLRELKNRRSDFVAFYSQLSLIKWSIWWALAMCGVLQVGNVVQSLWKEVASSSGVSHEYNGVVEALATLLAAGAATLVALIKVDWSLWGELTIGALSFLDAFLLLLASSAQHLWLVYLSHILYRMTYSFLITVASTQLALRVKHNSYALIFGFNTFIALVLFTVFTLLVTDEHGFHLNIRTQFVVYGLYYYCLTLVFVGAGVYKLTKEGWMPSIRVCWAPSREQISHLNIQSHDHEEDTSSPASTDKPI